MSPKAKPKAPPDITPAELADDLNSLAAIVREATTGSAKRIDPDPDANPPADPVGDSLFDQLRNASTGPDAPDRDSIKLVAAETIHGLRNLAMSGRLELKALDRGLALLERVVPALLTAMAAA